MNYDVAIVGGGPAGLSAALAARRRGKKTILFRLAAEHGRLGKASLVENYLGLPGRSGQELVQAFASHALQEGVDVEEAKVANIYPAGQGFILIAGDKSWQAGAVVFAPGAPAGSALPGERELVGRGVSYCATCDGQFFRGKKIAVIASLAESAAETAFLASLCREVLYFPLYQGAYPQKANVRVMQEKPVGILGGQAVSALKTDVAEHQVDGVFLFQNSLPPDSVIEGLALKENFIAVDQSMRTNIAGFFAAGDCTGQPWQIQRAAGQGQVAALSAVTYLSGGGLGVS